MRLGRKSIASNIGWARRRVSSRVLLIRVQVRSFETVRDPLDRNHFEP